jgi:hypothetical protein
VIDGEGLGVNADGVKGIMLRVASDVYGVLQYLKSIAIK